MDFWSGTVAAGDYHFERDEKQFLVSHSYQGSLKLRQSKITIIDKQMSTVLLIKESENGEIETYRNGTLQAVIKDIYSLPLMETYSLDGKSKVSSKFILTQYALKN